MTAAQVGGIGYQVDLQLEYELARESGGLGKWQDLPPRNFTGPELGAWANSGTTTVALAGLSFLTTQGTATAVTTSGAAATYALRLSRNACLTSAVAGNSATIRAGGLAAGLNFGGGLRYDMVWTTGLPSPNWRWFCGVNGAPTTNVNPDTFVTCFGVGRSLAAQANVQLMHNDGAGTCTLTDLGANFPAATADIAYRLQLWSAAGVDYIWQLTNLSTGALAHGLANLNVPDPTLGPIWCMYCNNNTDAQAVSLHFASVRAWQSLAA